MTDSRPIETAQAIRIATLREELRSFLRQSELIAQANGLTPQRYLLLLLIKGAPDGSEAATVTGLASRLRLARTTVSDLARRAEEAGLIAKEPSEADGRMTVLRLTDEGERRLERSFHTHEREHERLRTMLQLLLD